MFVLVGMAELTAAGIYMQYWLRMSDVDLGRRVLHHYQRRKPGERAPVRRSGVLVRLIKVLAIIGMIGFGLWMLFGGHGSKAESITCGNTVVSSPPAGTARSCRWR